MILWPIKMKITSAFWRASSLKSAMISTSFQLKIKLTEMITINFERLWRGINRNIGKQIISIASLSYVIICWRNDWPMKMSFIERQWLDRYQRGSSAMSKPVIKTYVLRISVSHLCSKCPSRLMIDL